MSKLPITNADVNTEHLELLGITAGMQNGTATLENSSAGFFFSLATLHSFWDLT